MTFYCTQCWREVPQGAVRCPHCGDDIAARHRQADFLDKLMAALHHPEPTTPIRAAWILGERHERQAVPALARLACECPDAFIVESAVEALGKIGGREARLAIENARLHPSPRVRTRAEQALRSLDNRIG